MLASHFSSPVFTIFAGTDRKTLYAHASVLSRSDTLRVLVQGDWKDSKDRQINLEEWDEETVARLLEYLYTNDYSSPLPHAKTLETASVGHSNTAQDSKVVASKAMSPSELSNSNTTALTVCSMPSYLTISTGFLGLHDAICSQDREVLTELDNITFLDEFAPIYKPSNCQRTDFVDWCKSSRVKGQSYSYSEAMMSHAKVYALANHAILLCLKQLAHRRLADAMIFLGSRRRLEPATSAEIADLARYIYANTDKLTSVQEPLRNLVSSFIAITIHKLDTAVIDSLMEEGGDCAVDVVSKIRNSLMFYRRHSKA